MKHEVLGEVRSRSLHEGARSELGEHMRAAVVGDHGMAGLGAAVETHDERRALGSHEIVDRGSFA
jgi:hypothetical protein